MRFAKERIRGSTGRRVHERDVDDGGDVGCPPPTGMAGGARGVDRFRSFRYSLRDERRHQMSAGCGRSHAVASVEDCREDCKRWRYV